MKKSSKHIRSVINHSVRNRSVFVPISAGFCATALAITGGVVSNASASSSVASSSSVVKSSTAKVAKKASSVTGGGQASEHSAVPTAPATNITKENAEKMAGCEAVIETIDNVKYLVIKPKGNADEGIISKGLRPAEFEAIQNKLTSKKASGATLKFEGNVHGYGSLNALFSDSKIKSLGNIGDFDVSNVTDMSYMFPYCDKLESLDGLKRWNTGKVRNMSQMFIDCHRLENLDGLKSWDTGNVGRMSFMFSDCHKLKSLDGLQNWKTDNVRDMSHMFSDCHRLENLDGLKSWNTSNVKSMFGMFKDCKSIKSLRGLKKWNTGSVMKMWNMFRGCKNLTNISAVQSWTFKENIHRIYTVAGMFSYCGKLSNISPIESWANIFYKECKSCYNPGPMFTGRSSGDSPITLTANWFKQNHTEIFSNFAHNAVFIFNEGNNNNIDSNIINKFTNDENIAKLLKHNIIITDNANLLDAMKDKKADEDDSHLVTVQYGDASEKTHIPAVLDSRINGQSGQPSYNPFEIIKHYIPTAVEEGAKTLRSKNEGVPTDYIAVANKELSSTSKLSDLFQTYTIKAAHKVTFKNDDSNDIAVKVAADGLNIAYLANRVVVANDAVLTGVHMPSNPSKDGSTFKEWNTKVDGTGVAFTKDSVVDTDKVVYAQYTKNDVHNPAPTPTPEPQPPTPKPSPEPTPNPTPGGDTPGGGLNPNGGGSGDKPGNNPDNNTDNNPDNNSDNGSGNTPGNNPNNTPGNGSNTNRNGGSAGGNGLNAGGSGSNSSNSAKSNDSDSAKDSAEDHSDSSDSAKDSAKDSDKDSKDSKDSAKSSASSSAKSASSSSNVGLIASIIGALAAIAAIVGGFFFFVLFGKKRKKRKDEDEN